MAIQLDLVGEPIRGSLEEASGSVARFAGWLELMSALEAIRARALASVTDPSAAASEGRTGA